MRRTTGLPILIWILLMIASGCEQGDPTLSNEQWLSIQQDLQQERIELAAQRDLLEADRRQWNERERHDPVVAATINSTALLLCCSLPLLMIALLIWPRSPEPSSESVSELLVDDLVTHRDRTTEPIKRIGHSAIPRKRKSTGR